MIILHSEKSSNWYCMGCESKHSFFQVALFGGGRLVTMTMDGKPVVPAEVNKDRVNLSWLDATWEEWKDLKDSEELKELMTIANKKAEQSEEHRAKGIGKGKGGKGTQ